MKLDHLANITLFLFNGGSIALLGLDYTLAGAISGLLSQPAFAYFSWKSRSWAMGMLTTWWTGWWAIIAWKAL